MALSEGASNFPAFSANFPAFSADSIRLDFVLHPSHTYIFTHTLIGNNECYSLIYKYSIVHSYSCTVLYVLYCTTLFAK